MQDNWKVNGRLTLDYGMRFVHATPQYDKLGQGTNFLPDKWTVGSAPQFYRPGCAVTVAAGTACPAASLQALNPVTGQLLGPNSSLAIGTIVQGSGNADQRSVRGRPGDRRHDLHVPGADGRAALRHGLRPDRRPDHGAARRHRALLRPAVRQLGHPHAGQSTDVEERDRPLRAAAEPRAGRPDDAGCAGVEHDRLRGEAADPRPSGAPASRRRSRGRRRSTWSASASTATTRCAPSTSTPSTSARRSWPSTRIRPGQHDARAARR